MQLQTWFIYFLAALGLSLSPGPNGLLALTHGALHGRRKALFTVAGGAVGFATLIALSMFGIGALLKASAVWLAVLKWVGGAYLVWLGVQVWRAPPIAALGPQVGRPASSGGALFRAGALAALTNPKASCFSPPSYRSSSIRRAACGCSFCSWRAPSWPSRSSPRC